MEAQTHLSHGSLVPAENDWPSVPQETPRAHVGNDETMAMSVDEPLHEKIAGGGDNEGHPMDVIAAAQALEGLRAGNESSQHWLNLRSKLLNRFYASSIETAYGFST